MPEGQVYEEPLLLVSFQILSPQANSRYHPPSMSDRLPIYEIEHDIIACHQFPRSSLVWDAAASIAPQTKRISPARMKIT